MPTFTEPAIPARLMHACTQSRSLTIRRRRTEEDQTTAARGRISSSSVAFWTASSFLRGRIASRLSTSPFLASSVASAGAQSSAASAWSSRYRVGIGGMSGDASARGGCIAACTCRTVVLGGASSVSRPKIPKNQRRPDLDDLARGSLHGVVALGGDVFAEDGFEVPAVGDRHRVDDQLAGEVFLPLGRSRERRRCRDRWHPGWPSCGRPRPARAIVVILVSASPNRLGTILLSSILSSLSAALSKIGPVSSTIGGRSFCWRPKTTISERRVRETWTAAGLPSRRRRARTDRPGGVAAARRVGDGQRHRVRRLVVVIVSRFGSSSTRTRPRNGSCGSRVRKALNAP